MIFIIIYILNNDVLKTFFIIISVAFIRRKNKKTSVGTFFHIQIHKNLYFSQLQFIPENQLKPENQLNIIASFFT